MSTVIAKETGEWAAALVPAQSPQFSCAPGILLQHRLAWNEWLQGPYLRLAHLGLGLEWVTPGYKVMTFICRLSFQLPGSSEIPTNPKQLPGNMSGVSNEVFLATNWHIAPATFQALCCIWVISKGKIIWLQKRKKVFSVILCENRGECLEIDSRH